MLISSQELSSQEQLLQALHKEGFEITQATLSRDLKLLKVAKAASSSGKYAYVLPNDALYKRVTHPMSISKMGLSTGFQSINFSGNMVVIKCHVGMANAACAAFDNMEWEGLVGTIAGDDTIFALCRTEATAHELKESIDRIVK